MAGNARPIYTGKWGSLLAFVIGITSFSWFSWLDTAAAESVTLRAIFLPATWGTVVKNTLAPQFEKETGIKVEVQLIARDGIHDKMATLFAAKDASFDVFNLDYNWIPEFGRAGDLVALDDQLTAEDKADFFPLALKVASWNGKLYGVPQTVHPHLLWYRKDLYGDPEIQKQYHDKTGQELSPPKTMDEWLQQVQFFNGNTFHGKKIYGWAAQAAKGFGNVHTWLSFLYTYGGQPFNSDFSKSTLSTPQGIAATKQWAEMMKYMPAGATGFICGRFCSTSWCLARSYPRAFASEIVCSPLDSSG